MKNIKEKEGVIVSVEKRKIIGFIPMVIACIGIVVLFDLYFLHTSSYSNQIIALILCCVIAPIIQCIIEFSDRRNLKIIVGSVSLIVISLFVLFLGEYMVTNIFHVSIVSYLYYPGMMINTVVSVIGAIYVIIAFISQKNQIIK